MATLPEKVVKRLTTYRKLLQDLLDGTSDYIYSHHLADLADVSPAQVRRDLMTVNVTGNQSLGYEIQALYDGLEDTLNTRTPQSVAIIGLGNLGRALTAYLHGRRKYLDLAAVFDVDPEKTGTQYQDVQCYHMDAFPKIAAEKKIRTVVLTVPDSAAQVLVDLMSECGVTGVIDFTHRNLRVPEQMFLRKMDMIGLLETVMYFAGQK